MAVKTKDIKLQYPITVKGENGNDIITDIIRIGRLKAKHIRRLPKEFFKDDGKNISPADIIPIIASLANMKESDIDEIDMEDLMTIGGELETFLSASLPTTKK